MWLINVYYISDKCNKYIGKTGCLKQNLKTPNWKLGDVFRRKDNAIAKNDKQWLT